MKPSHLLAFSVIFSSFLTWSSSSAASGLAESPDPGHLKLASANAVILEKGADTPLYEKKAEKQVSIASLTKLMTAMVVLDAKLPMSEEIEVGADDLDFIKGTHSRLSLGSRLTRSEMLRLALMSSENRAAAALSRHYPGGRMAFVVAMNDKAHKLGLQQTSFADPTGLSPENVSTAHDLTMMVEAAAHYPLIREYTTTPERTVEVAPTGRSLEYLNSNRLVRATDSEWDILLQKTGYISEAGRCLVMLVKIAQKEFVIVLLDSVGKYTRLGDAERVKSWLETGKSGNVPTLVAASSGVSKKASSQKTAKKSSTSKKNVAQKKGAGLSKTASASKKKTTKTASSQKKTGKNGRQA